MPSALEVAVGFRFGHRGEVRQQLEALRRRARPSTVEALIGRQIQQADSQTLYVEFSGGIDSSLVLAAATRRRRSLGLDPPIPVTRRYPHDPTTDESTYQQLMIDRLGLTDWIIFDTTDEVDILGPSSQRYLRQFGMGGSARTPSREWLLSQLDSPSWLISGEGGDEVLGPSPLAALHQLRRTLELRHHRRAAVKAAGASAVRSTRRQLERWRPLDLPWLRPDAARDAAHRMRSTLGGYRPTMAGFVAHQRSLTYISDGIDTLTAQAARHDITYCAPLLELDFLAGLLATIPEHHFFDRNTLLAQYAGDLLPKELLHRRTKAQFQRAILGRWTQEFIARWNGDGVDHTIVDAEALQHAWTDRIDARSFLLLQQAWLETEGRE